MHSNVQTERETPTTSLAHLYDIDYHRWLDATVAQLRTHDFSNLDLEHLIEEVESLGKRDKRAIASYLMRLCEHLLKMQYWQSERARCFRGWDVEGTNFRLKIQGILSDSPSLNAYLAQQFGIEYQKGRKLFLKASGIEDSTIPETPWFTLEQALDQDWLPWRPEESSSQ